MRATAKRLGSLPDPHIGTAHDVRRLVVCAHSRCRQLGNRDDMVETRSKDYQSTSSGRAFYHGRCYERKFGLAALLKLPKKQLTKLRLDDIGGDTARAILAKR